MSCNAALIDTAAWDGPSFAAAYQERIVAPLDHARDLLAVWPHVTRLYTRISPHEMLTDPLFEEVPGLVDVPHRHGAERVGECCGTHMRLPGGREVYMRDNSTWPTLGDDMPAAERIEEFQPAGPPATVADNSALIDMLLEVHNQQSPCEADGSTTSGGTAGDDGASGGMSTTGTDTTGGSSGADETDAGCGCDTPDRSFGGAWVLGLVCLAVRRRGRA
jgi:hypothetical protein